MTMHATDPLPMKLPPPSLDLAQLATYLKINMTTTTSFCSECIGDAGRIPFFSVSKSLNVADDGFFSFARHY